jgi:hypothetical protein
MQLKVEDSVAASAVEQLLFVGLVHEEIAATLGITVCLARHKLTHAHAWLRDAHEG